MRYTAIIITTLMSVGVMAQGVKDDIMTIVNKTHGTYRHGYSTLTSEEKKMYDKAIEDIAKFDANNAMPYYYHTTELTSMPLNKMSYQECTKYIMMMYADVPELYLLSSTVPRSNEKNYLARVKYAEAPEIYAEELEQIDYAYEQITSGITEGMSDYKKLRILHDNYISWGRYGDMAGADASTLKGALMNRRAVCEGLSRGFLYLCQRAGLKCIYVGGSTYLREGEDGPVFGNHAWNYVELEGKWYMVDIATDGGIANTCGYTTFLKGKDFAETKYKTTSTSGENVNSYYTSLPELAEESYVAKEEVKSYKVTFVSEDGYMIKKETIVEGTSAMMPDNMPQKVGFEITGWSEDISKVTKDMTVKPIYTAVMEVGLTADKTEMCLGEYINITATTTEEATFEWSVDGETQYGTDEAKKSTLYYYPTEKGTAKVKIVAKNKNGGTKSEETIEIKTKWTPAYMLTADKMTAETGEKITINATGFGEVEKVKYEIYDKETKMAEGGAEETSFDMEVTATEVGQRTYTVKIKAENGCEMAEENVNVEIKGKATGMERIEAKEEREEYDIMGRKADLKGKGLRVSKNGLRMVK